MDIVILKTVRKAGHKVWQPGQKAVVTNVYGKELIKSGHAREYRVVSGLTGAAPKASPAAKGVKATAVKKTKSRPAAKGE